MLRALLLTLSRQTWLRNWVETSSVASKFTSRFIAGQTLADAVRVIQKLNAENILASLDHLGENVTTAQEAFASRNDYLKALAGIADTRLRATVSIKPTQLGLDISEETCRQNVRTLAQRAKAIGAVVEIDMESSEYVDRTLEILRGVHREGLPVRAVIQAYLYRSEKDVLALSEQRIPVRLCKGAYREPAAVAFPKKRQVDVNYAKLMAILFERGVNPAIASHDEKLVWQAVEIVKRLRVSPDRFEFQMLYGIRRDLQRRLVSMGYRVRLYVPYGKAWYPYFMRRLAERPANLWFIARNALRA
jgi:proline dehydrogenase